MSGCEPGAPGRLPDWVPDAARHYLSHTEAGRSIRALARASGVHASTILRQVRRIESRRDDPLVDAAILALGGSQAPHLPPATRKDDDSMTHAAQQPVSPVRGDEVDSESRRVLHRLDEPGAVMAVAADMEKAVVVRDTADGRTQRLATVERTVAEAMALRDWIAPAGDAGRIRRYRISAAGRAELKRLLAAAPEGAAGFAEAQAPFAGGQREAAARDGEDGPRRRAFVRYNGIESPVAALARRREKDGTLFLSEELMAAADRLREDFELSQLGPQGAQDWEKLLLGGVERPPAAGMSPALLSGPAAARARVAAALGELGPGLGDIALRCCCFLEGLEVAERRLGWSSRSAKIVLRIALQRLWRHYEKTGAMRGVLIG